MVKLEVEEGRLLKRLKKLDNNLYAKFFETVEAVKDFLNRFIYNYPKYTDHSIFHSIRVIENIEMILEDKEAKNLNADELYVLLCASILHDIGMCIPVEKVQEFKESLEFQKYQETAPLADLADYLRDIHHELSHDFILKEYENLKIINDDYADVIAKIARAHRKVDINDFNIYETHKILRTGTEFVCMPYLACLIRIADELDITNKRTPSLIIKYYHPDDRKGIDEFEKQKALTIINRQRKILHIKGKCESKEIFNSLMYTVKKIDRIISECQKIIHKVENVGGKDYSLTLSIVENEIRPIGFEPWNIGFKYDDELIFNYFISKYLYLEKEIAIREILQNAIDACRLRKILINNYKPKISITIESNRVIFKDNGIGMDKYDIENYFSKIGKSFFTSIEEKTGFDSIGKFGIGILSYFLLSDNFIIKTKKQDSAPIRFRVDNVSQLDFLFYDNSNNVEEGTEVILPLNDDNRKIFDSLSLHLYLEKIFNNIKIPIDLIVHTEKGDYSNNPMFNPNYTELDLSDLLLKTPYNISNIGKGILYKSIEINEPEVVGKLNLYYSPDTNNELNFTNLSKYSKEIGIRVFYKGMFIQEIKSNNLYCLGGYININKKMDLNINKTQFTSFKQVNQIIQNYEIKLIIQLLDDYNSLILSNKRILQDGILNNVFRGRSFYSDSRILDYHDFFKNKLYNTAYYNDQFQISTLNEILNINSTFILYPIYESINLNEIEEKVEIASYYEQYEIPIYIPSYSNLLLFLEIIYRNRYHIKVVGGPLSPILIIDTNNIDDEYSRLFNKYLILEFDSENKTMFGSVYQSNDLFKCVINANNPLIKLVLELNGKLAESIKILFIELLEGISKSPNIFTEISQHVSIFNNFITEFNSLYKTSFSYKNFLGHE